MTKSMVQHDYAVIENNLQISCKQQAIFDFHRLLLFSRLFNFWTIECGVKVYDSDLIYVSTTYFC